MPRGPSKSPAPAEGRVLLDLTVTDIPDEEEFEQCAKRRKGTSSNLLGWFVPGRDQAPAPRAAAAQCSPRPAPALVPTGFKLAESAPASLRAQLGSLLVTGNAFYAPLTPDGGSWLWLVRGICPSGRERFEGLWASHPPNLSSGKIFGKEVTFHRYQQAFGTDYAFSGQTAAAAPLTEAAAPEVFSVKEALRSWLQKGSPDLQALSYEASLVNWYEGGGHWIGAHADDERGLVPGAPIFAVSWGESRIFRVTPKKQLTSEGFRAEAEVGDGDLIIMGGSCQKTHKHEVPKQAKKSGRRISLTFRCFQGQQEAGSRRKRSSA